MVPSCYLFSTFFFYVFKCHPFLHNCSFFILNSSLFSFSTYLSLFFFQSFSFFLSRIVFVSYVILSRMDCALMGVEQADRYVDQGSVLLMDRFLNYPDLPVLGSTAIDHILSYTYTGSAGDAASMSSPDSSHWTSSSGVESGTESMHDADVLPDSTTGLQLPSSSFHPDREDACSTNSDPLNSSCSEYSFAASPPSFENIIGEEQPASVPSLKRKEVTEPTNPTKKRARKSKVGPCELACPLCEYTTRVKEHLASHMNSHATDRKYMCIQCGQTFKWSHSLRRHQRTHTKDYKYSCAYCPKTFSRKDHLAVHEKLHDSDNSETFPCPQCGVTFKNKKNLTGHVKTHSTDKPYKCTSCESEFTRKASLTRHVLAAHAGQVYHCDICAAPFSYKSTLGKFFTSLLLKGRLNLF